MFQLIRAGDDFLTKTSKSYQEKFNKADFIKKIKDYANTKSKGFMRICFKN